MESFIPDHRKKPKESPITLSSYRHARVEPRDNAPIAGAMEGLAVHDDEVTEVDHAKKDEKKKKSGDTTSRSKSPKKEGEKEKKDKDKEKEKKDKDKAKEKKDKAKEEKEEKEKAKGKAKEPRVETPKSPPKAKGKKVEKEWSDQHGCAPAILVSQVMELGMEPLFENYLSPKLLEFKKTETFRRGARQWNLLCVTRTQDSKAFQVKDVADFTAQDLYDSFMHSKTDAGETFQNYLNDDAWIWDCMVNFESMKKETTTYEEFMNLFDDNLRAIENTYIDDENSGYIRTLKELYDKYWDRKKGRPKKL